MTNEPSLKFHLLTTALLTVGSAMVFWTPVRGYWHAVSIIGAMMLILGVWRWFVVTLYYFGMVMGETPDSESENHRRYGPGDQWEQQNIKP